MANPSKRRGTQFETDLIKWFRSIGLDAERLTLSGSEDEGDLVVKIGGIPFVVEAKAERERNLTDYVRQAERERDNYEKHRGIVPEMSPLSAHFVAISKKRNASVHDAFVIIPLHEWVRQVRPPM